MGFVAGPDLRRIISMSCRLAGAVSGRLVHLSARGTGRKITRKAPSRAHLGSGPCPLQIPPLRERLLCLGDVAVEGLRSDGFRFRTTANTGVQCIDGFQLLRSEVEVEDVEVFRDALGMH